MCETMHDLGIKGALNKIYLAVIGIPVLFSWLSQQCLGSFAVQAPSGKGDY